MRLIICKIFLMISGPVKYSIRNISSILGISKSSVHRHTKSIKKRNIYPESHLWETEEGYHWLRLLYFGAIIFFCVQCGIGAEKLSLFFKFLRLDKHIGIQPSTIRKVAVKACELLDNYQQEQEKQHKSSGETLKIVGGVDETYFDNMILVLMDLSSGYIFVEEESEDKSYETWMEKAKKVARKLGIEFKYFVSDRAKQLIQLATQGFKCLSVPDLFHASHEIVKLFGLKLNRKKDEIDKKLDKEISKLNLLKELSEDISEQEEIVKDLQNQQLEIGKAISTYHDILHRISIVLHPFNINDLSKANTANIQALLFSILEEAETLKENNNISSKKDHLKKFRNQIEGMASLIDTWWLWVDEYLQSDQIDEDCKAWIKQYLLPYLYWNNQADKTKDPDLREAYRYAADKALAELHIHPSTKMLMENEDLISWAKWMVSNFQRTSSAVEGRNGWLSQMNHNGRGLSPKRLKAQTVLHNYFLKRDDGTTAAERLFHAKFPDPLEWVIERMGDLPMPREPTKKAGSLKP